MLDEMTYVLSEMLQNLPYFWNTKNQSHKKSFFHFVLLYFSPNECPGLCQHMGQNKVARNEKRKKKLHKFSYFYAAKFEGFRWNIFSSINLLDISEE